MARSINIDGLGLHNFTVGPDCLIGVYDALKADQRGERVHEKHLYANPLDPQVCLFTSLGIWLNIEQAFFTNSEMLFLNEGAKKGSAAGRFSNHFSKIFIKRVEIVGNYLREAHGIQKGTGTKATTGTTVPPPSYCFDCKPW